MKGNSTSNLIKLTIKAIFIAILGLVFPPLYLFFGSIFLTDSLKEDVGIIKAMGSFVLVCLILSLLMGPSVGILILTIFGPMILIFNYMIINKSNVDLTIVVTSIVFFISIIFGAYTFGITPEVLKSQDAINTFIEVQTQILETSGNAIDLDQSTTALTMIYNRSLQLLPSVLLLISMFISYMTYTLAGRSLLKSNTLIMQPNSFIFFRVPKGMIITGIISMIAAFGLQDVIGEDYQIILDNIVVIYAFLLFFQGLSIAKFLMVRGRLNMFIQMLVIFGALLIPGVQIIFIFLGLLDVFINLRKIPG